MGIGWTDDDVVAFHHSWVLKTCLWLSMRKNAKAAPKKSEMVIEAHTPVSPLPLALTKSGGIR